MQKTLKKLLPLCILATVAIAIQSCSSDDEFYPQSNEEQTNNAAKSKASGTFGEHQKTDHLQKSPTDSLNFKAASEMADQNGDVYTPLLRPGPPRK